MPGSEEGWKHIGQSSGSLLNENMSLHHTILCQFYVGDESIKVCYELEPWKKDKVIC
jgi:hypothetical protein